MIRLTLALLLSSAFALAAPAQLESSQTKHYHVSWVEGMSGFATSLMGWAERDHAAIYGRLGIEAEGMTHIKLARDGASMRAMALADQGSSPPEWAGGLAYPSARVIYLNPGGGPDALEVTLRHEISHVAWGQVDPKRRAPRWFNEGLAIRLSEGGFSMERMWLMTEAASLDALLPLSELERGFPLGGPRVGVAYAQAVHFVGWLEGRDDGAGFKVLIRRMAEDPEITFEAALSEAFGADLAELEREWIQEVRVWWGWVPVLFGSSGVWSLGALLLLFGWRTRKRQQRAGLKRMAAEEAAADALDDPLAQPHRRGRFVDPYSGRPPTIH